MKPILFIDANVLAKFEYEVLKDYIDNTSIVLTDDVAKEILATKNVAIDHPEFNDKFNLFFNSAGGLNDNIYLMLSHIPIGIENIVANTKNKLYLKSRGAICSAHHLWLPSIVNPALITNITTHLNSELTWRLKKGEADFNDPTFKNAINEMKISQAKEAKPYYETSNVNVHKLFYSWIKRDKDIIANKHKISDARLIAHALDWLMAFQTNVRIISADYDILDLKNNLFAAIFDKYVIYETLRQECKLIDLKPEEHIYINVPMARIHEICKQTLKRIDASNNVLFFSVDFYNKEKGTYDTFDNIIPDWLLEFIRSYKGNVDCYALNENSYKNYPIQYIWYADWDQYIEDYKMALERQPITQENLYLPPSIRFEVWKRDINKFTNPMDEMKCKMICQYEMQEINNPEMISSFIDISEIDSNVDTYQKRNTHTM